MRVTWFTAKRQPFVLRTIVVQLLDQLAVKLRFSLPVVYYHELAEGEGFEPIGPLAESAPFQDAALNQTQPSFYKLAGKHQTHVQLNPLKVVGMTRLELVTYTMSM